MFNMARKKQLLTNLELLDQITISIDVLRLQIIKKTASLTNHLVKTASAVIVLLVVLKVLGELLDSCGKKRYLYFGGTGILRVLSVLGNDFRLLLFRNHFCFLRILNYAVP